MEFCNGGELSKALEKYQSKYGCSFSEEIVKHLMRQNINAFQYIHKLKIIHRDIKLDNILLNYETEEDKNNLNLMKATIKIIDFGFANQHIHANVNWETDLKIYQQKQNLHIMKVLLKNIIIFIDSIGIIKCYKNGFSPKNMMANPGFF